MAEARDFTVLSSEPRFSGTVFDVRTDEVRMPDGSVGRRDVIRHPGAVGVVAMDDRGMVVMVRQYRHPVGVLLLELPAGLLDVQGESALAAAQRELFEEAALAATDWQVLVDLHTSPGMTDEAIRIYLARGLTEVAEGDRFEAEHEEVSMTVERYPLADLVDQVLAGELTNGPAVAERAGWQGLRSADSPWRARPSTPAS
jgi:8-oxo-dGDP phosphatase